MVRTRVLQGRFTLVTIEEVCVGGDEVMYLGVHYVEELRVLFGPIAFNRLYCVMAFAFTFTATEGVAIVLLCYVC